jgi:hypothetical protein
MRIELYKIIKDEPQFDLGKRIELINRASLKKRNRKHNLELIRLEAFEKRGPLWLCDFVKIRTHHGPGKVGVEEPVKGFGLSADQGFGEETAFLWNSKNDYCVIQYNHYGVRPKAIAEYLGLFVHDNPAGLEFAPKLDDKIHAKIRKTKWVTKFTLAIAPKELSNADFDLGAGLGSAAKSLMHSDADRIEITVTAKKGRSLDLNLTAAANWVDRLIGRTGARSGDTEGSPVRAAKATTKGSPLEASEVLDLLHHRISLEDDLSPGVDKRIPLPARWDAVHRACDLWKPLMK